MISDYPGLSIRGGTRYFYPPKMVIGTSCFKRVLHMHKIFMKIIQILIKINSEVLVDLKNIESPDYPFDIFKLFLAQ
jgi:hypothetical protein